MAHASSDFTSCGPVLGGDLGLEGDGRSVFLVLTDGITAELCFAHAVALCLTVLSSDLQGKLPLLLSRMNEVGKVFLVTNSDYKYTDVSAV